MAYDAGSIEAHLLAQFDEVGFKAFDRAYERARVEASKKIEAKLGADVDDRAFAVYQAKLREAQARASRKEHFKAQLGADYDGRAFQAMERDLAKTRAETAKLDKDLVKLASTERETERNTSFLGRAFGGLAAGAGGAGNGMLKLRTDIGPLSGPLRAMAGVLATLIPLTVALAGAATALGASLAAAAAGAAAVGVGFAAVMGPLAGLMGALTNRLGLLGDAYKALSNEQVKGGTQATAVAETQRAATERIRSAQESLADSNRAVQRAQEDLTDARFKARREVQDLTDAVTHSAFAEERASLTLREVLQRLAETEADPTATRLQLDQARFAVREARHAVKDTQREHQRANSDAKRGTDTVKDATEQLAQARRQAARASDQVAAANAAAAVALAKQGAAATDAQQKMAQLSETEQRLVRTFQGFAKSFRATFQPATDAIFNGVNGALERLQPVMERFRGRFGRLGESIGGIIDHAAESLAGPEWTRALDAFITTAQRIVKPLSNAFGSVVNIFRNIAVAAQPYVIEFADYLERALGGLEDDSRGNGLKRTIRSLVDSTKDWWNLMVAVGDLLITVFSGGKKEGDSLVESMTRMVRRWDAFLETDEGQKRMKDFFRDAVQMTKDLARVLGWVVAGMVRLSIWAMKVNQAWDTVNLALRKGMVAVGQELRDWVISGFDLLLGALTSLMGGISSLFSALGSLPGGGKFKAIAGEIDAARDSMDGFRKSTREASEELGRRQNIQLMQADVKLLRDRLKTLDKGTDDYRETAEKLRGKQRQLNRAVSDAKEAGDRGAKGPRALAASAKNALVTIDDANAAIVSSYNQIASQLGDLKPLKFKASRALKSLVDQPNGISDAPPVPGLKRAVGGWIGERGMVGEDTVPIIAAPGEAVLNRHQVPMVDEALAQAGYGGLDDLFARVQRPHYMARGGYVQGAVPPTNKATQNLAQEMFAKGFNVTSGLRGSGGTYHQAGSALDFGDSVNDLGAVWRALFPRRGQFAELFGPQGLYHGTQRFSDPGLQSTHRDHVHVALLTALKGLLGRAVNGGGGGAVASIAAPRIGGPAGMLRSIAQRTVSKLTGAANDKLGASGSAMGGGGAGKAGSNAQVRSWLYHGLKLAGLPPTAANINTLYGRVMQESGGNPRAINLWDSNAKAGYPSRGLLQTIPQTFNQYKVRGHDDIYNPVHNVAAAVRYMLARYGRLVGRGSGGYAKGGRVGAKRPTTRRGGSGTQLSIKALRGKQTDRIGAYDAALASVERDQKLYTQADRRYNLTDEELVDPETGFVNVQAVQQKASELAALIAIRERIEDKLRQARNIARRVVQAYKTIIKRFQRSLRHAKGKKRDGPKAQIAAYRSHLAEWEGKAEDTASDVEDAHLDVLELGKERAEVLGTKPDPRPTDEPDAADSPSAVDVTPAPEPVQLPPSAEEIARGVAEQLRSFDAGRADLFRNFGSNFISPAAQANSFLAAGGVRNFGATGGAAGYEQSGSVVGAAGGGTDVTLINNYAAPPPDPHTYSRAVAFELKAAV